MFDFKMKSLCVLAVAGSLLTGCVSSTIDGMGSKRKQIMLYSEKEYLQQSTQSYNNIITTAKQRGLIVNNAQVNRVAKRLIAQVPHYRADAANWNWEVNTIRDNEINAFCLSGGKIGVLTGSITKINATDDELAALIGHEIAHALRDHGREKVSKKLLTGLGVLAASSAGLGDMVVSSTSLLGDYGVNLPGSRKLESEADLLGVDIMVRAGYNPQGAVSFWNKVVAQEKQGTKIDFLSTHPTSEKRIVEIQDYINQNYRK